MRPHRELVDQDPGVGGLEELHRQHAGHVELRGDTHRDPLRLDREAGVEARRRGHHLGADPAALHRLDHGPGGDLAGRRTRDERRELAPEVDQLLGQHLDTGRLRGGEGVGALLGRVDAPHTLAVVPATGGLEDAGVAERGHLRRGADHRVAGTRNTERGEAGAHDGLVLGVHQRLGTGTHSELGLQRVEVVGRHVLVVEGHHRAALGHRAQRLQVAVVADCVVGDHLGRAHALGLGEEPERDAERRGRLGEHPGQLPAPDHRDRGGEGVVHGTTLSTGLRVGLRVQS